VAAVALLAAAGFAGLAFVASAPAVATELGCGRATVDAAGVRAVGTDVLSAR
jgi:hypothetical protein